MQDSQQGKLPPDQPSAKAQQDPYAIIKRLVEWAEHTGGWEAPCWAEAQQLIETRELVGQQGFDEVQQLVLHSYERGEFAHLTPDGVEDCGDGLLKFLLTELSRQEDCDGFATAVDRVDTAVRQLLDLRTDLANAYLNPASKFYRGAAPKSDSPSPSP